MATVESGITGRDGYIINTSVEKAIKYIEGRAENRDLNGDGHALLRELKEAAERHSAEPTLIAVALYLAIRFEQGRGDRMAWSDLQDMKAILTTTYRDHVAEILRLDRRPADIINEKAETFSDGAAPN